MARKNLIAGNWKMNASHLEAIQMVQKLSYRLDPEDFDRVDVVVCPPFTSLRSVQTVIEADHLEIRLGAQNCHWEVQGAYTGEVSAAMVAETGCSFVLVGNSERRQLFGETDETVSGNFPWKGRPACPARQLNRSRLSSCQLWQPSSAGTLMLETP